MENHSTLHFILWFCFSPIPFNKEKQPKIHSRNWHVYISSGSHYLLVLYSENVINIAQAIMCECDHSELKDNEVSYDELKIKIQDELTL